MPQSLERSLIQVLQQTDSNVILLLQNGSFMHGQINCHDNDSIIIKKDFHQNNLVIAKSSIASIIPIDKRSNIKKIIEKMNLHRKVNYPKNHGQL